MEITPACEEVIKFLPLLFYLLVFEPCLLYTSYEGAIIPANAALNGLVGEDKPEITLTYTGKANDGTEVNGTEIPVLAGTYTVTASITDSNYRLKAEGTTAEFTVAKASPGLRCV